MCGIAGIVDLEGKRDINRGALERMTQALAHRGPDDHGYYFEPGIGFGHRRLSIVDIDGGQQPFRTRSGKTILTFNGEIYNHADLRHEAEPLGVKFRTRSDTEVLAELIERRGVDVLGDLQGMFAFAAWDQRAETLLLARDRLGEKPLYTHITDNGFLLFASEIDALLASDRVPNVIEPTAVADYLFYGYVPDPGCIYSHIEKLSPGHVRIFRRGQKVRAPHRYWQLTRFGQGPRSLDEAAEDLSGRLRHVVSAQMMADVPIAAFLSGGLDSAAVVSAATHSTDRLRTLTMGLDDPALDETAAGAAMAHHLGTDHQSLKAHTELASLVPTLAAIYGEPFADSSAAPTFLLCQQAKNWASVALSGDGGDELFAGYTRYAGIAREHHIRRLLPGPFRRSVIAGLGAVYPRWHSAPAPLRLKTGLQAIGESPGAGYARAVSAVLPDVTRSLLTEELRDYRPERHVETAYLAADTDDPVTAAQIADLKTWLPGRMLVKIDRASMAVGLEVRPPLLDPSLVEWAISLPRAFKFHAGDHKRVMTAALADQLPASALAAPKRGFAAPIDRAFRGAESPLQQKLRSATAWRDSGYFAVDHVEKLAAQHAKGAGQYGQALWSIVMFDAFLTRETANRPPQPHR